MKKERSVNSFFIGMRLDSSATMQSVICLFDECCDSSDYTSILPAMDMRQGKLFVFSHISHCERIFPFGIIFLFNTFFCQEKLNVYESETACMEDQRAMYEISEGNMHETVGRFFTIGDMKDKAAPEKLQGVLDSGAGRAGRG